MLRCGAGKNEQVLGEYLNPAMLVRGKKVEKKASKKRKG